jgi:hypothetical protein
MVRIDENEANQLTEREEKYRQSLIDEGDEAKEQVAHSVLASVYSCCPPSNICLMLSTTARSETAKL